MTKNGKSIEEIMNDNKVYEKSNFVLLVSSDKKKAEQIRAALWDMQNPGDKMDNKPIIHTQYIYGDR